MAWGASYLINCVRLGYQNSFTKKSLNKTNRNANYKESRSLVTLSEGYKGHGNLKRLSKKNDDKQFFEGEKENKLTKRTKNTSHHKRKNNQCKLKLNSWHSEQDMEKKFKTSYNATC